MASPEGGADSGKGGLQAGGFTDFKVMNVPVGQALIGVVLAGIADIGIRILEPRLPRDIGGLKPNQRRALLLALGAWALQTDFVKRQGFIGTAGANAGSIILAADAITQLGDLRRQVAALGRGQGGPAAAAAAQATHHSHNSHSSHSPGHDRAAMAGV